MVEICKSEKSTSVLANLQTVRADKVSEFRRFSCLRAKARFLRWNNWYSVAAAGPDFLFGIVIALTSFVLVRALASLVRPRIQSHILSRRQLEQSRPVQGLLSHGPEMPRGRVLPADAPTIPPTKQTLGSWCGGCLPEAFWPTCVDFRLFASFPLAVVSLPLVWPSVQAGCITRITSKPAASCNICDIWTRAA